jgi:hypothetical protein
MIFTAGNGYAEQKYLTQMVLTHKCIDIFTYVETFVVNAYLFKYLNMLKNS